MTAHGLVEQFKDRLYSACPEQTSPEEQNRYYKEVDEAVDWFLGQAEAIADGGES